MADGLYELIMLW